MVRDEDRPIRGLWVETDAGWVAGVVRALAAAGPTGGDLEPRCREDDNSTPSTSRWLRFSAGLKCSALTAEMSRTICVLKQPPRESCWPKPRVDTVRSALRVRNSPLGGSSYSNGTGAIPMANCSVCSKQ
jgi:hypothetical protein